MANPTTFRSAADGIPVIDKDPSAILDYTIDLGTLGWLYPGETITGTPVITVESGLTKMSQSNTTTTVTVWLSGGSLGTSPMVTVHFVTNLGREDDRSFRCNIKQR